MDVLRDLGRLHFDLAGFPLPRQLDALLTLTTLEHLHYGSDYPFTPEFAAAMAGERLAEVGDPPGSLVETPSRQHRTPLPRPRHRPRMTADWNAMNHQLELGYLVLEVPEPDSLTPVLADVVGLVPGEPTASGAAPGATTDGPNGLWSEPGPANDAVAIGFEAVDAEAFERHRGAPRGDRRPRWSRTAAAAEGRRVARLARTTAPWGVDVEIVLGLEDAPTPFASPLVPGGFLTEGVGFGHVVFATPAFEESDDRS